MSVVMGRRRFVGLSAMAALGATSRGFAAASPPDLARVIVDNDFAGDPDGLFQLAHHVLCPSVTIPLIVGSHLPRPFASGHDAADGAARAAEVLDLVGRRGGAAPIAGSEAPIASRSAWRPSPATAAIVAEAMRADVATPLVYAAGAGLTELALAWLAEPRIGPRIRLVWIGGNPHPGLGARLPIEPGPEFNLSIDPLAAQIIFNESDIEIWQVPSDAYGQMLFGTAELEELGLSGRLGAYLKARVDAVPEMLARIPGMPPMRRTDACVLGDSPLVTLTALVPPFSADPTSSRYVAMPRPRLLADGRYEPMATGRPMRVYTSIDAGLTFRDMAARFRLLARKQQARGAPAALSCRR